MNIDRNSTAWTTRSNRDNPTICPWFRHTHRHLSGFGLPHWSDSWQLHRHWQDQVGLKVKKPTSASERSVFKINRWPLLASRKSLDHVDEINCCLPSNKNLGAGNTCHSSFLLSTLAKWMLTSLSLCKEPLLLLSRLPDMLYKIHFNCFFLWPLPSQPFYKKQQEPLQTFDVIFKIPVQELVGLTAWSSITKLYLALSGSPSISGIRQEWKGIK